MTQILSCLTGDRQAAEYSNVLNTGKRRDAYTELYNLLLAKTGETSNITRAVLKDAIMVSLYGSLSKPAQLFGDNVTDFYELMAQEYPYVWQLTKFTVKAWNSEVDSYSWTMPDGFEALIKVYNKEYLDFSFCNYNYTTQVKVNKPNKYGRAYLAHIIHSIDSLIVREITAYAMHNPKRIQRIRDLLAGKNVLSVTNDVNQEMVPLLLEKYKKSGFLSVHLLEFIDSETIKLVDENDLVELLALVPNKPFAIRSTHDSFCVLPNYGNNLRRLYIAQLSKVAKSDLLQDILNQLPIGKVLFNKADNDMWKDVLDSEYALS